MMVLFYFDWFGTAEELDELEKTLTTAATKGGINYKGTYAPDNRKFHFVGVFETKSYDKLIKILTDPKNLSRDYKKLTHGTFEILRGPLK